MNSIDLFSDCINKVPYIRMRNIETMTEPIVIA